MILLDNDLYPGVFHIYFNNELFLTIDCTEQAYIIKYELMQYLHRNFATDAYQQRWFIQVFFDTKLANIIKPYIITLHNFLCINCSSHSVKFRFKDIMVV